MAFGIYVHTPYCIQRCGYCDFATYEQSKILPPSDYFSVLHKEIRQHSHFYTKQPIDTLYFGGGTPSLVAPELIVSALQELANQGFPLKPNAEVTIEINPATINEKKINQYLKNGINRFSVGAQTFNDYHLKYLGREHTADETRETLRLLQSYKVNFSFDLLFAFAGQSLSNLRKDLEEVVAFQPNHVSPYCLTVPDSHRFSKNRPLDEVQIQMFEAISDTLTKADYNRYEISNFSKNGFESRHNEIYWTDQEYWGIGLSAHSYKKENWGTRFWNHSNIDNYVEQITNNSLQNLKEYPVEQIENLKLNECVTDFCHTALRRANGLDQTHFIDKFGEEIYSKIHSILEQNVSQGWLDYSSGSYRLTKAGVIISNHVFRTLTFLPSEIPN